MKIPDDDRERLRQTFNQVAGSYHWARPDYPAELFDDLIAVARQRAPAGSPDFAHPGPRSREDPPPSPPERGAADRRSG